MEKYKGILCISYPELVRSEDNPMGLMSDANYKYYCNPERSNPIRVIVRGGNGRIALIEYDSLPLKYRQQWEQLHGDPRDMNKQADLVDRIIIDTAARTIFEKHRLGNNVNLKEDVQERYARTAEIFNALTETLENAVQARLQAKLTMRGLWSDHLIPAVKKAKAAYQPNDIPDCDRKIKTKYELYIKDGYTSLIHANFGNRNRSKLDQLAISTIIKFAGNERQLAGATACEAYNNWAILHDRPTMTARTFNMYAQKYTDIIIGSRDGKGKARDMFEECIMRNRPTAPMLLVNSDDNNLDFLFRSTKEIAKNGKVKTVTTDYFRYKMYLVLDAHNDYVLGYAIGDQITTELVVEAYRNAMNHIKELTGGYYLWHEIVADNWNRTTMKEFFQRQAKTTLTQVGNAKAKYIERFFGIEWHEDMKRFGNHSGYNITAKKKPNPDWIKANAKNFPTKAEGVIQIAKFIDRLRNKVVGKNNETRKQLWIKNFFKSEKAQQNAISDQRFLNIFGVQRYKKGGEEPQINRIDNKKGIEITINGDKYIYQIPNELYRATLGKDAYTIIDPADLSRILVKTVDEQQIFVAQQRRLVPACFADMVEGDMEYWQSQLYLREKRKDDIKKERAEHEERTRDIDVETYLQIGDLTKAPRQAAEDAYIAQILGKIESIHSIITH